MAVALSSQQFSWIEGLIGSGEIDRALSAASELCGGIPPSVEALRLRALAECLLERYDVAANTIAAAKALPGGEVTRLDALAAFVEDQRRALERAPVYDAFIADSSEAMRWHTERPHNLEIFAREDLFEEGLAEIAKSGRQLQRHALSPGRAKSLSAQLVAASDAMMSAALAEAPPLLFLSDSHSRYFEWIVHEGLLPQRVAGVCSVSEANLYGLYMPSRSVPTRRRFREALDSFPPHTVVVLHLGEVDCRAVYWNLRRRLGAFDRSFFETIVGNLRRLLEEIAGTHRRIVVTAPVRPTYLARPEDKMVDGELILRLTNGLTQAMRSTCEERGFGFVSINPDLVEFGAGLGNRYFRTVWGRREVTHHLCAPKVAGLWARALTPHLR